MPNQIMYLRFSLRLWELPHYRGRAITQAVSCSPIILEIPVKFRGQSIWKLTNWHRDNFLSECWAVHLSISSIGAPELFIYPSPTLHNLSKWQYPHYNLFKNM